MATVSKQSISKTFASLMIGREFPWYSAGVETTGGGCEAYVIHAAVSEADDAERFVVMITDWQSQSLETEGPYAITVFDADYNHVLEWSSDTPCRNAEITVDAVEVMAMLYSIAANERGGA